MNLPDDVLSVIERLEKAGYEAWAVGGCVRDSLLGHTPKDYDITTSCLPETVCTLFPRCIHTGLAYGTVTVLTESIPVEVTVFRRESGYNDNRHPSSVSPADSLLADLSRRDFTINAMAWNPKRGLADPFDGQCDLKQKLVRAVGNPAVRFEEDALRILRCFRFASKLDFEIEETTRKAACLLSPALKNISVERITAELRLLLTGSRPELLQSLVDAGGLRHIGLNHLPRADLLKQLSPDLSLRLTAILWLSQTDAEMLAKCRFENRVVAAAAAMLNQLEMPPPTNSVELKRQFSSLPPEQWKDLLELRTVLLGENTRTVSQWLIEAKNQPWNRSMLAISGKELESLGYKGTQIGAILSGLLEQVLEHPERNTKTTLLDMAKQLSF